MKGYEKYKRQYYLPPETCMEWSKKEYIQKAPKWCSVDLRDGNQSLIIPMSLDEKVEFFKLLVEVGFKEIEIGFPAASETEFEFLRKLIDEHMIPDDVTIQVLTQAREHIIRRTFEAVKGAKNAVIHVYNSTSFAQREQVFKKSREEVKQIAVEGAKLLKKLTEEDGGNYRFEYSPESFTGTEIEYALDVCNAVLDVWQPTSENNVIINLPVTVQMSMPHIYAQQIEYMCKHMKYREHVIVSLHPHNDRGCGVADTELGILAGADRIEGTLFGNGERTGNVDIITLAMNMYAHGIDPELNFHNMPHIVEVYERVSRMEVPMRHPYAGQLVFAAFSGSHQDAIAKGMHYRDEVDPSHWTVPYLPIDPRDVGRVYETDVIRINSQSGKGGIGYMLEEYYGYDLPKDMREDVGYFMKNVSDHEHKELLPNEVNDLFQKEYMNVAMPYELIDYYFTKVDDRVTCSLNITFDGEEMDIGGSGNGRLDAISNALRDNTKLQFDILDYKEHALSKGSSSKAVSYVKIIDCRQKHQWGVGLDEDIIASSVKALFSCINRAVLQKRAEETK
ncbi:2-isopropylmalate synthase [Amedibacillus sp. YH-ame6]